MKFNLDDFFIFELDWKAVVAIAIALVAITIMTL